MNSARDRLDGGNNVYCTEFWHTWTANSTLAKGLYLRRILVDLESVRARAHEELLACVK